MGLREQEGARRKHSSTVQAPGADSILSDPSPALSPCHPGCHAPLHSQERSLPSHQQKQLPATHFSSLLSTLSLRSGLGLLLCPAWQQEWSCRAHSPATVPPSSCEAAPWLHVPLGAVQLPAAPRQHGMKPRLISSVHHVDRKIICCPYLSALS